MSSNNPVGDVPASSSDRQPAGPKRPAGQPSLVPGTTLLAVAAVLIIIVLVKPHVPDWLRITIAVAAVLVVLALLVIAFAVFRGSTRRNR